MAMSQVFDRRTLRERCTAYVRKRIVSGAIRGGDHLVEARLSEQLGVSRGTLREALRPLEMEGLLVGDGRGHLLVPELSASEILEVFEVRAALEALAAEKLAQRADRDGIVRELRECLEPLKHSGLEFAEQIDVDLGFHARMCELTNSSTLVGAWTRLMGTIEMMIISAGPSNAEPRMRHPEHIAIVDAIASGDSRSARGAVLDHMADFSHRYVSDALDKESRID